MMLSSVPRPDSIVLCGFIAVLCVSIMLFERNSTKGKGKCQVPVFDMSNRDFRSSFFERLFSTADSDTNPIMPGERLSAGRGGGKIEEGRATGRKHKKMIPWGCAPV